MLRLTKIRQSLIRFTAITITLVGLTASVNAIWGPIWPTRPVFVPGTSSFGSSIDIPFIITNRSALFGLSNLGIECRLHELIAQGPTSTIKMQSVTIAARGVNNYLGANSSGSYTCPFRGIGLVDNRDAADQIKKAIISFVAVYDLKFWGHTQTNSTTYNLDTATVPPQWVPGAELK